MERIVPDTSVLVDGRFRRFIEDSDVEYEVLIPEAVVMEIVHQANQGRSVGRAGLEEMRILRRMANEGHIKLRFGGRKPTIEEINNAHIGAIDEIVRETAFENDALLVTGDRVQRDSTIIKGGEVIYLPPGSTSPLRIENLFDDETMSVHIKSEMAVYAKKGMPGRFELVRIKEAMRHHDVEDIANDIIERARAMPDAFIEVDEAGATVVQMHEYRIAITRPPFSDKLEITAVRPVKKLSLEDYHPSEKLLRRFEERAEGILVAGAPGAGKSTFVQALAEYYHSKGRIVKTMEKPRDLQVSDEITQYTALGGSMERTGDILLLVRPDYTIFDEMRTTDDFKVFADLRLAGAGMVGVVHATRGVDAVQRFIGRVELGTIPQVVDTIIYIINGSIGEIYVLEYTVKVPSGMSQEDLARPVIEVRDFESDEVRYEIYSFGEQVVVVPIKGGGVTGAEHMAAMALQEMFHETMGIHVKAKVSGNRAIIYAPEEEIPHIIGRSGKRVAAMEKELNMALDIRPMSEFRRVDGEEHRRRGYGEERMRLWDGEERIELKPSVLVKRNNIHISVPKSWGRSNFTLYIGGEWVLDGRLDKNGKFTLNKKQKVAKVITQALKMGQDITLIIQ